MLPPVATNVYNLPDSPSQALRDGVLFICRRRGISRTLFSPLRSVEDPRWDNIYYYYYTTNTTILLLLYYYYRCGDSGEQNWGLAKKKNKKKWPISCHCCGAPPPPTRPPTFLSRTLSIFQPPPLFPRRWLLTRFSKIESGARGKRRRDGLISGARIRRHL